MMTTSLSHKALAFSIQSLLTEKLSNPCYGMRLDKLPDDVRAPDDVTPRSVSASSVGDSPCSEGSSLYSRDHNSGSPRTPKQAMSVSSADSSPEDEGTGQEEVANGKKPRTIFTREQVQRLEEAYAQKRYLTRRERKELAKEADISHTQVKIWFQNRRAKAKLKDRKTMAIMQSALQQQRLYYNGPQSHIPASLPQVPQVPHRVPRVPAHVPQIQSHVPTLPQLQNDSYVKSLLPTTGVDLGSRVARRSKGKSAFSWYNI